jgi:uncharacterized protein YndB with AHSA1/START domain
MSTSPTPPSNTSDRELVLTRVVNAPRELAFRAWSAPEHISRWWGPRGFSTTTHEMRFAVGGVWRNTMHGPDGRDYKNRVVYTQIVAPERIAYDHDDDGSGDSPPFHVTVTFDDLGARTRVTLRIVFDSIKQHDETVKFGAVEGGQQTLGRLEEFLAAST